MKGNKQLYLIALIASILLLVYYYRTPERFDIEPNTVMGGYNSAMDDYKADLELYDE